MCSSLCTSSRTANDCSGTTSDRASQTTPQSRFDVSNRGAGGILASVTTKEASELLNRFRAGKVGAAEVLHAFQAEPVADLGFAQVDLHRSLRKNFPEVVYGEGKTPAQVAAIAERIARSEKRFLVTRITAEHARAVR